MTVPSPLAECSGMPKSGAPAGSDATPELETIFRAQFSRLVRALAGITDESADAVQEAFVEAFRHWGTISSYDDPALWIRRVAINKARDRRRRTNRDARLRLRLVRAGFRSSATGGRAEAERLDVTAAIRQLPIRQQLAVTLYYVADLSIAEVAKTMGVSGGTVKAALHAARKRLAPLLEDADD